MKILAIGDIVSRVGRDSVMSYLDRHAGEYDLIIANGENSSHGNGMGRAAYEELSRCGVDAFTLGNHAWGTRDIASLMKYNDNIVRPANFDRSCPGRGSATVRSKSGVAVGIINLIGQVYMPCTADSPFAAAEREIERLTPHTRIILVDFHAEATSEKKAMGFFLDGKASAVFGTHTHVQTADETILPGGTGYITDLGMTGVYHSVLGMDKKTVMHRFVTGMPTRFEIATGKGEFSACEFEIDEKSGKTIKIKRICEREL